MLNKHYTKAKRTRRSALRRIAGLRPYSSILAGIFAFFLLFGVATPLKVPAYSQISAPLILPLPAPAPLILDSQFTALDKALSSYDAPPIRVELPLATTINYKPSTVAVAKAAPDLSNTPFKTSYEAVAALKASGKPKIAIIIDDMGLSSKYQRQILDLETPMTLSYLPLRRARDRIGSKRGDAWV